jgi:hypothetical protein
VDVVIEATVSGEPIIVSVEVKEWSRRLDKNAVAELIAKHDRLATNRLLIVSKSGFTKRALAKVAASGGKVAAVTPADVELAAAPTLFVESYTMTAKDIVVVVRKPNGELVRLTGRHGEGVEVYDEDGNAGSLEDVIGLLVNSDRVRECIAREFHEVPDKGDVWGFSVQLPEIDQIPGMPPLFVKWTETRLSRVLWELRWRSPA